MRPLVIAALPLCLLSVAACGDRLPYFPRSEFWQALPAQVDLEPDSEAYITDLLRAKYGGRFHINLIEYNIPIARPTSSTPRVDVRLTIPSNPRILPGVPIPDGARPSVGSDGHLAVLDQAGGASFEFWQAQRTGASWEATTGVRFDLQGDGVNQKGDGVRASSLSLLLGVITYDEVRSGEEIRHALAWAFDTPNSQFYAPPATSSDGKNAGRPTSVPEGGRLQLDPALDVTTLGLSQTGVRLAQAMQRYGVICVDASGDSSLYAEDLAGSGRSWDGLLAYDELQRVPVDRLRVVKMARKIPIP